MQGIHENCHPPTCDLFLLTFKSFTTNAFMLLPNQYLVKRKIIVIASLLSLNQVPFLTPEQRRGDYLSTGCGNAIRSRQPFPFVLANAYFSYTSDIHNEKQLNSLSYTILTSLFFPFVPRSTKKSVVASLSTNFLSHAILNNNRWRANYLKQSQK
ncbi:hypothetical protein TNCV_1303101 [Trichonephila clavipes]|nr:hypothetical protein TNCV_1303101 [Trichonephila clavipes]